MRKLPLWLRWALTLGVFGGLAVAVVRGIDISNDSQTGDAASLIQANRAARRVVEADQAPRSAPLSGGSPRLGLERAIGADVRDRVRRDLLGGPLKGVRCVPLSGGRAVRGPFRCTVRAGRIAYPFRGVVDVRARRLTWCKVDPVPPGQAPVPLRPRCQA